MQRFSLRTSDPGEASRTVDALFGGPVSFRDSPDADFRFVLDGFVRADEFSVARITVPGAASIRSAGSFGSSVTHARSGSPAWQLAEHRGTFQSPVLLPAGHPFEVITGARGGDTVSIGIAADTLERHAGRSMAGTWSNGPRIATPETAGALRSFMAYIGTTLDTVPDIFERDLVAVALMDSAIALIVSSFELGAVADDPSASMPRTLRRAIAFIEDNAASPISSADIAAAARLSVRGLQGLFLRELGISPTAYLRGARLDAARAELLRSDADTAQVSQVAVRWGFSHLSRFAQDYRGRFGELPSVTLRR